MSRENRKYLRYVFPREKEITAILKATNGDEVFEARVLNVSEGGLGLATNKERSEGLERDLEFVLEKISGEQLLSTLEGINLRVKWVLNYDSLQNVGLSCDFVDITEEMQTTIFQLLPTE